MPKKRKDWHRKESPMLNRGQSWVVDDDHNEKDIYLKKLVGTSFIFYTNV